MPIRFRRAEVLAVRETGERWQVVEVRVLPRPGGPPSDDEVALAFCETDLLGPLAPGDVVVVNTSARRLELGTGGLDFVYWVEGRLPPDPPLGRQYGHLMKLRYTPLQRPTLSVEDGPSPLRSAYLRQERAGLGGRPLVVLGLHSQLPGVVAGIRSVSTAPIAFVQNTAGALPASFSRLLRELRSRSLLALVVTAGHAYGGDLEAVSPASGLLAAAAAGARVIIAGPGPGIAGTGTRYGTSALEQLEFLHIGAALTATPVLCLRLSAADRRPRHN
ncbi:MAG TPA: DUF3866 family protein, partial [Bacillota bacterium]